MTINYDRSARVWKQIGPDYKVLEFPAGMDGKRAARMADMQDSAYYDVAMAVIALSDGSEAVIDRVLDAVELVETGKVRGDYVGSQSDSGEVYAVGFEGMPRRYTCTCPDFEYRAIEVGVLGPACKHTLSKHIVYLVGE